MGVSLIYLTVKSHSDLSVLLPCPSSLFFPSVFLGKKVFVLRMAKGWQRNDATLEMTGKALPRFHLAGEASLPNTAISHNLPSTPNMEHQSINNKGKSKLSLKELRTLNSFSWYKATCYCDFWPPGVGLDDFPHGLLWKVLLHIHLPDPPTI